METDENGQSDLFPRPVAHYVSRSHANLSPGVMGREKQRKKEKKCGIWNRRKKKSASQHMDRRLSPV